MAEEYKLSHTAEEIDKGISQVETNKQDILTHKQDEAVHVTAAEKQAWNNKANKATTLEGYGITDGATKEEIGQLEKTIAHYITPEMYGAKGDGTTDDSVAIQQAIDNAGSSGIVYLTKKIYKISTNLVLSTKFSKFVCEGTILHDGTDIPIHIKNQYIDVYVDTLDSANSEVPVLMSGMENQVLFCNVKVKRLKGSTKGIRLYTNSKPICYNKISINENNATDCCVELWADASYINENWFWLGKMSNWKEAVRLHSDESLNVNSGYGVNDNKFFSGIFEDGQEDGCAIVLDRTTGNKFENFRCQENYGANSIKFKGLCSKNDIQLSAIRLEEVDISALGSGSLNNVLRGRLHVNDYDAGTEAQVNYDWGIVYNPMYANTSMSVGTSTVVDNIIKQYNSEIKTSLYFTYTSVNGMTLTLSRIFSDSGSMARGFPLMMSFSASSGRILLVDTNGDTILDNRNGEYAETTVSVRWNGYDKTNKHNIWEVKKLGEHLVSIQSIKKTNTEGLIDTYTVTLTNGDASTFTVTNGKDGANGEDGEKGADGYTPRKGVDYFDGDDGYTPVRGTDYWTETDKAEIKSYVDEAILGGAW